MNDCDRLRSNGQLPRRVVIRRDEAIDEELSHFRLETAAYSFGYVAGWAGNIERVWTNLADVQRVANVLINVVEGTDARWSSSRLV